jgi:hypothetical protein
MGKKIYSRRKLFEKITRLTSLNIFMEKNPGAQVSLKVWKKLKAEGYPGGVRLKPKDLRDYFASEVASQVNDPSVVMKLLRHTNLTTNNKVPAAGGRTDARGGEKSRGQFPGPIQGPILP